MANPTTHLPPELLDSLQTLSTGWDPEKLPPEQQRQVISLLEHLLDTAAIQMAEEGTLTPDGLSYTPEIHRAILKLHLTALNAMVEKACEEKLPAESLEPLLSHGAYRCLEQAKHVIKTHLEAGNPIEDEVSETELKRFLTEAAVYALSYTIESYRQQKAARLQQAETTEQPSPSPEGSSGPLASETHSSGENSTFLKQILLVLLGIVLILFTADKITATGMDGPMTLMCLMFALSASFGYYFYKVLQFQQRELKALKKHLQMQSPEGEEGKASLPSLGVHTLEIQLGRDLELLNTTVMLPMELTLFRTKMAESLGLQLADIPLTVNTSLGESKYRILLRGDVVAQGQVFPPRLRVTDQQLEYAHLSVPENSINAVDESTSEDVYWVPADWSGLVQLSGKPKSASRVILKHLENVIFTHIDEVVGQTEILAVLARLRELSPGLVERLVPHPLSEGTLRRVWVNLLRERVPVKDITFLFERLIELSALSREPDVLSEQLRLAMARKLCHMNTDVSGVMYVVVPSESWERRLIDSFNQPRWSTPFGLSPSEMETLAETTVSRMTYAENTYHCRPVILCAPAIRMALFLFLNHYIPGITVLGHNELVPDTQIEVVGTIDA